MVYCLLKYQLNLTLGHPVMTLQTLTILWIFLGFFDTVCTFVCDYLETSRDARNSFHTSKEYLWYIVLLKYQLNLTLGHPVMTLQTLIILWIFLGFFDTVCTFVCDYLETSRDIGKSCFVII